ncbi:glycine-rich selenoprotein-like [Cylas formicarius]|uniref:glycine-rich selenoprotein-like n=1 Tax=Cylas formicarius TaxID=197179 RepID=UPI002958A017|nr:glycine-rich selenoprotein-like [Cylas formicarius]
MVYVRSDGTVTENPPLHTRLVSFVFGIFSFVIFFFKSLLGMDTSSSKASTSSGSSFGGGGGSGGPFGPGKGGGGPRFRSMSDINKPTVRGVGGCPGGSCGM